VKRVLFVDDEAPVLAGLRNRLHRLHSKWDMAFAQSGELALQMMRESPFDVVVTDWRMPEMDGGRLLQSVNEQWPQTIRIVLSGYAEADQAVRLVPFAHQYLSKPCEPQRLENVIERCMLLHELLNQPALRAVVGRIRKLPTLPRIYSQIQRAVQDDRATLGDVARIIESDTALTARLLQIVNSAFFRLPKCISNIEQGVSYLGLRAIRNLALSLEICCAWQGGVDQVCNLQKLQEHAQVVAAATGSLTVKSAISDDAMLAALLHDIGYWVLAQECPQALASAVEFAADRAVPLHVAELAVIGASHAEIGAYLLGLWGLPHSVVEAVAHHHRPDRVQHTEFDVLSALVIAQSLAGSEDSVAFERGVPPDPKVEADYLLASKAPFGWGEAARRVQETIEALEVATCKSRGPGLAPR
jgi:putative nucleotidyltransferase with HDIG domain